MSTFTCYKLFDYNRFIFYTVRLRLRLDAASLNSMLRNVQVSTAVMTLDRVSLRDKVGFYASKRKLNTRVLCVRLRALAHRW